jgi:hypothetical protein
MADWILSGDDFTYLADVVSKWLAYGIGFGAVVWMIGQVIGLIYKFVRY